MYDNVNDEVTTLPHREPAVVGACYRAGAAAVALATVVVVALAWVRVFAGDDDDDSVGWRLASAVALTLMLPLAALAFLDAAPRWLEIHRDHVLMLSWLPCRRKPARLALAQVKRIDLHSRSCPFCGPCTEPFARSSGASTSWGGHVHLVHKTRGDHGMRVSPESLDRVRAALSLAGFPAERIREVSGCC